MAEGSDRDKTFDIGYTARAYAPNGSAAYKRYGGLPFTSGGGPLLGHELTLMGNSNKSPSFEQGAAFIYMGADETSANGNPPIALKLYELSYIATLHAFSTHQFFNPYLGFRLGFDVIKGAADVIGKASQTGFVGAAMAGVDFNFGETLVLRGGFAYDGVYTGDSTGNGSLSGYAVEAGVIFRL